MPAPSRLPNPHASLTPARQTVGVKAALVAATALVATTAALASTHASLVPVRSSPLTLRGAGFGPAEPVRLTLYGVRASTVRLTASAQGRFVARVPFAVAACTLWSARAVGRSTGSVTYRARAAGCAVGGNALTGTGLWGVVKRGPITPVCIAEQPCDAPAPNVGVTISQGGAAVSRSTTGADGSFAVSLVPGRYTIAVAGRAPSQAAVVVAGHVTRADFMIDTGIR